MSTAEPSGVAADERAPSHFVGIGASAGGLEAIESLFKSMPQDSGLGFIVIQHLSPDHKSLMVELLSKHTRMPVHRAEEGMRVEKDSIYLIPPKKNLSIFHGKLLLKDQDPNRGINLPIDIFLRSLAEDQGEKAVGVILSGTGSDGTRGIRSIKETGGMVMVQSEESARFDGMPKSAIGTGLPDFILAPEEMPRHLLSFVKHPYATKTELSDSLLTDEDGLTRIFALLRERSKVDFTYYKPTTVIRRIERRMTVNQIRDLRDYVRFLERYPSEVLTLYRELLIGVTSFFRDREAFELLLDHHLPELFRREAGRQVRFWVAGCSSGEEAYSLAILARECMEQMGKVVDVKIFATDVDRDAVLQAGNGVYPESIAADLSPQLLAKYFYRKDDVFTVARHIREMVVFAQHNLIKDPPFTNIDLVSCRNLLIYLQPVLQRKALQMFSFSLNDQGVLLLGSSETTGDMEEIFEPLHHKWKLYRSRGKRLGRRADGEPLAALDTGRYLARPHFGHRASAVRQFEEERVLERLLQGLSGECAPLMLVVNEAMELLHLVGDSEGFLRLPPGKMQNDVTRMAAQDLAIPLATGVQKVFKSRSEVTYSNVHIEHQGERRLYRMRIRPLPGKKGQEPLVMVLLEEAAKREPPGAQDDEAQNFDLDREARQRIQDLEQELQFSRENLQATVEELETSNEELQATNEELLASNEELQSTNEELQSVNEELYTVNAEFQGKIVELTELNNDLDNLLNSTELGTVFLDENLVIRRYTPPVSEVFKILPGDIGRPITYLGHQFHELDPLTVIRRVQQEGQAAQEEAELRDGRWFLMRVTPYRITPETVSGFVVTLVDITLVKAAQHALELSDERNALAMRAARMGPWEWDIESGRMEWADSIDALFGLAPGEFPGTWTAFLDRIHPQDRSAVTAAAERALKEQAAFEVEHRVVWSDGSEHWLVEVGEVLYEAARPVRMVGVVRDVSERVAREREVVRRNRELEQAHAELSRAGEELARSRSLFQGILQAAQCGMGMVRDGVLQWVNSAVQAITGMSQDELVGGEPGRLFCDPGVFDALLQGTPRAIGDSGSEPLPTCWRRRDGGEVEVLIRFSVLDHRRPESGIIFAGLKTSQARVEASEA